MSEKPLQFVPKGGDEMRIERELKSSGLETYAPNELEFEFTKVGEESLSFIISEWQNLIREQHLPILNKVNSDHAITHETVDSETLEDCRKELARYYKEITSVDTPEEMESYWLANQADIQYRLAAVLS